MSDECAECRRLQRDKDLLEDRVDELRDRVDELQGWQAQAEELESDLSVMRKERNSAEMEAVALTDEVAYLRKELAKWEGGKRWLSVKR